MSDKECEHYTDPETSLVNDGGTSLPSRIFGALGHRRRRYILYYLRDHEHADTDTLATQLVAWEQNTPLTEVSTQDVDQVKTVLHTHLPKLTDYGLIEYDQRSNTVKYTEPPRLLADILELVSTIEQPP